MKVVNIIGAMWGIVGISLILITAILRVYPHVIDAYNTGLSIIDWLVLVIWCIFMIIAEGYRGFQKNFSPRVASRTWYLVSNGKAIDLLLAPLFGMCYFHSSKRRIITSWSLTVGIISLIALVRLFPQPWRGIVDSGVALGLAYGFVWIYIFLIMTIKKQNYLVSPELTDTDSHINS
ncbi:MAG TPA: hypothetical protein VIH90_03915 [Candidatus Saccharimonadales bacterium]